MPIEKTAKALAEEIEVARSLCGKYESMEIALEVFEGAEHICLHDRKPCSIERFRCPLGWWTH